MSRNSESLPIMGAKEGRVLAASYAAAHPEDRAFADYFERFTFTGWRQHTQWIGDDEDGKTYAPVWTRIVEWFYVPHDYAAPKASNSCWSRGGRCSGPGSRGDWYYAHEFTWTRPEEVSVVGEQIALFV